MRWIRAIVAGCGSRLPSSPLLIEAAVMLVIVADFVRVVVRLIGLDGALGWDEAVYAVRARAWVDPDAPLSGWSHIRPPLLPIIGTLPVLAGGDEWQLRAIGLASGVGLLAGSWWLARSVAGPVAGLLAAAVLATGPAMQRWSATFLTDLPAAAILMAVVIILWRELELRSRPGWGLVLAAALAALAFLIRYGSILAIVPIVALATVIWWRQLISVPRITLAAVGVGVVVAVGHLTWSVMRTGTPLGVLSDAQDVVSLDVLGREPIDVYLKYVDFALAGDAGQTAIVAGLVALPVLIFAARRWPEWSRPMRAAAFLVPVALVQVAMLTRGVGHAEERFFFFSTALLVVAGCILGARVARGLPWAANAVLLALAVWAIVGSRGPAVDFAFDITGRTARFYDQYRMTSHQMVPLVSDDCGILTGGDPIVAWYTGCETNPIGRPAPGAPVADRLEATDRWLLVLRRSGGGSIDAAARAVLEGGAEPPTRLMDPTTGGTIAWAWRLAD